MKIPRLFLVLSLAIFAATSVVAGPISVAFSTSAATLSFLFPSPVGGGDTLQLNGSSGSLGLDTTSPTTNFINAGTYTTVGTNGTGVLFPTLSYDLTLDGVTQTLSQGVTWSITLTIDTFVTTASAPIQFVTSAGIWNVTLEAFSFSNGGQTGVRPIQVQADFSPVPEPATFGLVGGAALASLAVLRRRRA